MLKGAIFDLDGVIVDTVPLHFKAWKKMFAEYGKRFTFHDYKQKVDGIPRLDGAQAILKGIPPGEVKKGARRKQRYYLDLLNKEGVKAYASSLRLIKELRRNNIKAAVISSSRNCRTILKKINLLKDLDAVVGGKEITRGKPDPQIFLKALRKLHVRPSESVVFEDAVLGIEAARRGHIFTIGIDRHHDPNRLRKADLIVKDARQVSVRKLKEILPQ
ncbi:MAG: beta-phosphoglucomutase family hydrolase [Candidatus Omnitrophica bacterium]|nr:beta-phosphoglucomutase family hydrolase [Candidatus Omnitrophota bacterium]MDD5553124.1 beta-phosphoglucomutase family hydrolase [Candidatus Omnitrophota bacterium]